MSTIKRSLQAKTFYADHSIGDNILSGWEAKPLDENSFLIKRRDGSTRKVVVGEAIPKVGEVSVNSAGNLSVGNFTVVVGENLIPDWEAKPTSGKDTFFIKRPKEQGHNLRDVSLGSDLEGMGQVVMDEYGNLRVGDKSIRVARKQFEINLLVWSVPDAKEGFQSVINLIEPGNKGNRKDGVYGAFCRTRMGSNKPAIFKEKGPNGELLNTAVFWPSENKKYVVGKIRDRNDAILEKEALRAEKKLERRIKEECRETNLELEEHMDYPDLVEATKIREKMNKDSWRVHNFTVSKGGHMFGLKPDPVKSNDREYSR